MNVQNLFNACSKIVEAAYPAGMAGIAPPAPIQGPGFFPVMSGSFHSGSLTDDLGHRRIMIVGQDFGHEQDVKACRIDPNADVNSPTGKALRKLLKMAGIPEEECFFTNALFGVRTTATNTGRSPGWDDPHFVDRCRKALERQIDALDPRAIICLGIQAPRLLAGIFPECGVWTGTTFTKIDVARKAVIEIGSPARTVQMGTVLVHPSFRHANVWRRRYKGHEGDAAEVEMLKDVWKEVRSLP